MTSTILTVEMRGAISGTLISMKRIISSIHDDDVQVESKKVQKSRGSQTEVISLLNQNFFTALSTIPSAMPYEKSHGWLFTGKFMNDGH